MIRRYSGNPIIKPSDIKLFNDEFEVFGVFNPGAIKYQNKIILLLRVALKGKDEKNWISVLVCDKSNNFKIKILRWRKTKSLKVYRKDPRFYIINGKRFLTSLSLFYYAESDDGFNFLLSDKPSLFPQNENEIFGIEDPRIISYDSKLFYITYTAVSEHSFCTALVSTIDFKNYNNLGIIFPPENKDVVLFDRKINNKFFCLHRPNVSFLGKPSIWIAESENFTHWGNNKLLLTPRNNKWERNKIGAGPPPILTNKGWLLIYHSSGDDEIYSLSAVLLDKDEPTKVIGRTEKPFMMPKYSYETEGVVPNIIFSNGWINSEDDKLLIYYGAADSYVAVAETSISYLTSLCKQV